MGSIYSPTFFKMMLELHACMGQQCVCHCVQTVKSFGTHSTLHTTRVVLAADFVTCGPQYLSSALESDTPHNGVASSLVGTFGYFLRGLAEQL